MFKMYIIIEGVRLECVVEDLVKIIMQVMGVLLWCKVDVKYCKNEVFVDVIEDVNFLMSVIGFVF